METIPTAIESLKAGGASPRRRFYRLLHTIQLAAARNLKAFAPNNLRLLSSGRSLILPAPAECLFVRGRSASSTPDRQPLQGRQCAYSGKRHDDSGLFTGLAPGREMDLPKAALSRLHTPILYVLGGPTDIAYANGMDDYARIDRVPAAVVNLQNAGHGGTFFEPNGGKAAQIAVAWFNWQLKRDGVAKRMFVGADCGLCRDPAVTLQSKLQVTFLRQI